MTLPNVQSTFCSSRSRDAGENLFGSAGTFGMYLIIEYNTQWTPDKDCGFIDHAFRGDMRQRWDELWDSLPEPRLQLIRQRGKSIDTDGISVYIAVPHETNPLLFAFVFDDYAQILDLDMHKLLTGDIEYHQYLMEDPLYLVCTHAKHDPCCARHGLPTYKAFSDAVNQPTVWQSSHIGGHRFAGTALLLPHGLYYGRIDRDDVPELVENYRAGNVVISAYRGRACYDKVEQNAEYFLRRESQNTQLNAFRYLETEEADSAYTVRFEELGAGKVHAISMKTTLSEWSIPMSCSKEETESKDVFTLSDYTVTAQES